MKFFLMSLILLTNFKVHGEVLKLGVAQGEAVQEVAELLLREIYKKAHIEAEINPYPAARLTTEVLNNRVDGEVARIGIYFEKNPTLFKVEPSYYHLVTATFSLKEKKIKIKSSKDLIKYKVGIIRGVYHAAAATADLANIEIVDSVDQLFDMLNAGRIDVAVDVELNGKFKILQKKMDKVEMSGVLARREFFNVLIQSKKENSDKISKAIIEMKKSGELNKLINKFEKKILSEIK